MIRGHFTLEQRIILRAIAKRRTGRGELKRLAHEWNRTVLSVYDAIGYLREVGDYKGRRGHRGRGPPKPGSYTQRMRKIWAEWDSTHVNRPPASPA